jgi:hypothetical protein
MKNYSLVRHILHLSILTSINNLLWAGLSSTIISMSLMEAFDRIELVIMATGNQIYL